ncbi:MAG: CBU_0592 family membrane protein [Terriglobales bacterium]
MDISLARQASSFAGALLILVAYVGHQWGWMDSRKAAYNILNAIGSAILAYIAFHPFQIGFVVLEITWALVSLYALVRPEAQS